MSAPYLPALYPTTPYLTDDHERLRQQVRDFAETEVAPRVPHMESSTTVELELSTRIAQKGWIGVTIDPAYGGMGAGHLAKTILVEELSRLSGAMGAMVQASQLGAAKIIHFGTEEQKRTWLPAIARGDVLPTIAVTEPESGGHVLGMTSSAVRDGDDYVLNGRKVHVGNSHVGGLHGVVMRTGPGSGGLSAFLVEADRPGLTVGPYRPAMGLRGFGFGELRFDDCRVPAANRLGAEGDGLHVAYSSSVLYGRPNLTAVALGIHQGIVEETLRFVQERPRHGGTLADLPTIQQKIGAIQARLMTARLLAYHAVHLLDHGQPCDPDLINAKYYNVTSSRTSASAALDIHAAAGLQTDRAIERLFRDAQHTYAPAGTSEIQLLRLAEEALGTSRGQWSRRLAALTTYRRASTLLPSPT